MDKVEKYGEIIQKVIQEYGGDRLYSYQLSVISYVKEVDKILGIILQPFREYLG
ncbi:hypothetical protein [Dapis sp. BLCC M172]|uniref:hypothetical protein n=1 Tax=Dapis sp. BLCC M172 TaxID=2975281 RepID=UPI003CEF74C0